MPRVRRMKAADLGAAPAGTLFVLPLRAATAAAHREVALALWDAVVPATPRDTGRAQFSWHLTHGAPDFTVPPAGQYAEPSRPAIGLPEPGQSSWLTTGLHYMPPLEHGHSGQAPQGMLRLGLLQVQARRREIAGRVRRREG